MASQFKVLFRGAAATSSQTLYTVPAATTAVVNNVVVANTSNASRTYTLSLDGVKIAEAVTVPANDSLAIDIKQILDATKTITGLASNTDVTFHISGLEITS
jgi:hypothetical protein